MQLYLLYLQARQRILFESQLPIRYIMMSYLWKMLFICDLLQKRISAVSSYSRHH